ncbi:LA_2272 family surface repeat-containing protein [Rhizosphaericola mali]|uniref:Carboxypeptidase-like regulatory domain-containing protein n=1 Tax=Rhizosphaericola mali TaxID=2545455 RepID=A0A5P2G3H2_9BACT|nr:hypothetical protein [Rhizosphaericola mali]QES88679.1 hypothetical protein E0W69_008445 [Rhizosphaericola mali]
MEKLLFIKLNSSLKNKILRSHGLAFLFLLCINNLIVAQSLLKQKVPQFEVDNSSISLALKKLSAVSKIPFSFQSDVFEENSIVSIKKRNCNLNELLSLILPIFYQYKQEKDYVIITPREYTQLSGYVKDLSKQENIGHVHLVYSNDVNYKETKKDGSFNISIPFVKKGDVLLCTKEFYYDTIVPLANLHSEYLTITMRPIPVLEMTPVKLSSISNNKNEPKNNLPFAFHIIGGRSNNVKSFEFGTIFNHNISNGKGIQIAGVINLIDKSMSGIQIAGLHNYVGDTSKGIQLSAILNKTEGLSNGVQLAAINRSHKLKGVQIGIINVADSSVGWTIGPLNFANMNHFPRISYFTNNLFFSNVSFKLGNEKLYFVANTGASYINKKRYYVSVGFGHDFRLSQKLSLSTVLTYGRMRNFVYSDGHQYGIFDKKPTASYARNTENALIQLQSNLNFSISQNTSLFIGPTFNYTGKNVNEPIVPNYSGFPSNKLLGWQFGITNQSWLQTRIINRMFEHYKWSVQIGLEQNLAFVNNTQSKALRYTNIDVRFQKHLMESVSFITSFGFNQVQHENYNIYSGSYDNWSLSHKFSYYQSLGLKLYATKHLYAGLQSIILINKPYSEQSRISWVPELGWDLGKKISLSSLYYPSERNVYIRLGYIIFGKKNYSLHTVNNKTEN